MILTFNFNLNTGDSSGLPTVQSDFLQWFADKDIIDFCIIADPSKPLDRKIWSDGKHLHVAWTIPDYFDAFHPEVAKDIAELSHAYQVTTILKPDYLVEEYLRSIPLPKNSREIMFVHMLWRGLFNALMDQPNFIDGGLWRGAEEYAKKVHMEGIAIQNSREIICNSQFTYDDLHRYYTISRKQKVHCLPLGIYKENYPYKPCIDNKKVCYFGRLDSQKGIHWLLRDFVDRKDWWKENPIIVLGEGAYEPVICRAQRDGLVDFRWAVSKDEMKDILSEVKYCVFPSIYEPYCLALNEALCMGKICIVAATGGGMLEQVENGKNGFVVDFWYSFLADYIDNLEENVSPEDFAQISEEAHKNSRGIKDHLLALGDVLW